MARKPKPRACRVCGCTDEWGCDEGCEWVEWDLCSACAPHLSDGELADTLAQALESVGLPRGVPLRAGRGKRGDR